MENDNLSDEERKILNEMNKNWENENEKINVFWKIEYPNYTFDERIAYWSNSINQQMRWQAESGLNEYTVFSKEWYEHIKEKEPRIDEIMDIAFEKFLSWEWSKEEYLKRINEIT